ncbi:MAG: hypothetical protein AUI47_08655 [Acidobacteria bacterium 13_1_40CM_2_68_5]|nr:MAG: hypothetical protein AUI47_08655 [Acidobacteria bacterium 13_1_40CM_2_68_5]
MRSLPLAAHPRRRLARAALLAIVGLAGAVPSLAGTTGNLTGTVVDQTGPVPGVTVTLNGPGLPAGAQTVTDAQGKFRFLAVPPGAYTISASLGERPPVSRSGIVASAGETTAIPPILLTIEKVQVTAQTEEQELIQPGSTTLGQNLGAKTLETLPTARSYESVVEMVSGSAGDDGTGGHSIYGASGLESTYIIDGVNTTAVMTGKAGKELNFDFVEEIQVKTGGYEPEFGRALGGVVNVVTKSGTNQLQGLFSTEWSLRNDTGNPLPAGDLTISKVGDTATFPMSLGGPIVRDHAWFFLAYAPTREDTTHPQFNAAIDGRNEATQFKRSNLFSGKITWQVTPAQRLTLTSFSDPAEWQRQSERWGLGEDTKSTTGGTDTALKYTGIFGTGFILDGQIGTHRESRSDEPLPFEFTVGPDRHSSTPSVRKNPGGTNVGSAPPQNPDDPTQVNAYELRYLSAGPYPYSGEDKADRDFARLTLEHLVDGHEIKVGADREQNHLDQVEDYGWGTGMALEWTDLRASDAQGHAIGTPTSVLGIRRCWGDGQGGCLQWKDQIQPTSQTVSSSVYIQDRWTINPRVTLTYGARLEGQDLRDGGGRTVAKVSDTLSPRFGVTYDPQGEGRMKIHGSWGRFSDTLPLEITSRVFDPRITSIRLYRTSGQGYNSYDQFVGTLLSSDPSLGHLCATDTPADNAGWQRIGFGCWDFERSPADPVAHDPFGRVLTPFQTIDFGTRFPSPVDSRLRAGSQDEAILGFEWAFTPHWALGTRVIRRSLNQAIEDLSLDNGRTYIVGNPGGAYHITPDPNDHAWFSGDARCVPGDPTTYDFCGTGERLGCVPGRECTIDNAGLSAAGFSPFPRPTRDFKGAEISVDKTFSKGFDLSASYLYSKTEGNYRGRYIEERDPHPTEAFDFPILTYNAQGFLPQDRRHQLKIRGMYQFPRGFHAGGTYRWLSGTPLSATTDPDNFNNPFAYGSIYLLPQGAAGRTPSLQQLDLHLSYDWKISERVRSVLFLDVFNLLDRQTPTRFNQQFLHAGSAENLSCTSVPGFCAYSDATTFGGEPTTEFLDQLPGAGNHNGKADAAEWDAWARSIEGRFHSVEALYRYFKTTTFPYRNPYTNQDEQVAAFPGFGNCPAGLPDDPTSCKGIYDLYGLSLERQAPRSLRFGMKVSF